MVSRCDGLVSIQLPVWVALCIPLLLAGCEDSKTATKEASKQKVTVAEAFAAEIPLIQEFVGQTAAVKLVDVRAKVQGYLMERPFTEGSDVKKGDTLYVIDQRPFQAAVDQNKAGLEQNQGRLDFAQEQHKRYEKLKDEGTASVQKYESTRAEAIEAAGALAASQAALQNAELNLDYATITAPIHGRVGNTLVNIGNLVSAEETLLTTIVQLDPIYVYFSPSEAAYQKMVPFEAKSPLKVAMVLSSGTTFPHQGVVDFVDNRVDPNTWTLKMRAIIPNPDQTQRPGQFVTTKVTLADKHEVVLIPAKAVAQDEGGHYVYVVGKDNTVHQQGVTVGSEYKASYVIEKGVKPGDRVVKKPTDANEATLYTEIRDRFSKLQDASARINFLQRIGGESQITSALLTAPAGLTDLSDTERALLRGKVEGQVDPGIVTERDAMTKAMQQAEEAWTRAEKLIARRGGLQKPSSDAA